MQFRFPGTCSRCAKAKPSDEWTITRIASGARISIKVPVCASCKSALNRIMVIAWAVALPFAVVTSLVLVYGTNLSKHGVGGVVGALALALIPLLVIKEVVAWVMGAFFAKIRFTRDGEMTIIFPEPAYQRAFDRLNGL